MKLRIVGWILRAADAERMRVANGEVLALNDRILKQAEEVLAKLDVQAAQLAAADRLANALIDGDSDRAARAVLDYRALRLEHLP